ncbi:MAG: hypothetical protein AAGF88_01485 [Pseudomonadota bacterium]
MSSLTPVAAIGALVALGLAGWQAASTPPNIPRDVPIPTDPAWAVSLPGVAALPARLNSEAPRPPLILPNDTTRLGLACGIEMRAEAVPPAMVALEIVDPCDPQQEIAISHAGIRVTAQSDGMGAVAVSLPVFANPADILVETTGGFSQQISVDVPDLVDYHRVAVAWRGGANLNLVAEEPGQRMPTDLQNPGRPANAQLGIGGFLTALGTPGSDARAQIYTFPRDPVVPNQRIRLHVEITAQPCHATTAAQTVELLDTGGTRATDFDITPAGCLGDSRDLVLQNLLQDLRIATR